ncbi:MAG: hypothetical protein EOO85_23715 [Pedobacter sp.]|nr:MAG: hypothetical protein EOO85_23715 [Pedobacter sp.]
MEIKLAKAVPAVSLVDLMKSVEEGKKNGKHFPLENEKYLRSSASIILKRDFPNRKYSVSKQPKSVLVYWERRSA